MAHIDLPKDDKECVDAALFTPKGDMWTYSPKDESGLDPKPYSEKREN